MVSWEVRNSGETYEDAARRLYWEAKALRDSNETLQRQYDEVKDRWLYIMKPVITTETRLVNPCTQAITVKVHPQAHEMRVISSVNPAAMQHLVKPLSETIARSVFAQWLEQTSGERDNG